MNKFKKRSKGSLARGFTLVEVVVAMAVFSIAMLAITQVFISIIKSYRLTKNMQRNIENTQYALDLIGKTLRTSEINIPSSYVNRLEIFDPSQGKCLIYEISDGYLKWASATSSDLGHCSFSTMNLVNFIDSRVTGNFRVVANTSGNQVGKITINLKVQQAGKSARFQTTVSLRNHP